MSLDRLLLVQPHKPSAAARLETLRCGIICPFTILYICFLRQLLAANYQWIAPGDIGGKGFEKYEMHVQNKTPLLYHSLSPGRLR
jgi:hypothetical protein